MTDKDPAHDIELPPLPKGDIAADTCPVMWVHSAAQTQEYARAAVEADRKRRGEPSKEDYFGTYDNDDCMFNLRGFWGNEKELIDKGIIIPLYTHPHPPNEAGKERDLVAKLLEALTELCDEIDKHEIHTAISETNISWFKRRAREALAAIKGASDERN